MSGLETWFAVSQWLTREARVLDARRYDLWLDLLHPEVRYRVPGRVYRLQSDPRDFATWSIDGELDPAQGLALIDDDFEALRVRVGRLQSGMAWAEMPASMSRRLVGDVVIESREGPVLTVASTLFLAKTRQDESVLFTAERRDELEAAGEGYLLRDRVVVLDAVELPTENLSLIF